MLVVADTSPVRYLILIDQITVLPVLFGRVVMPLAVAQELRHAHAPDRVRTWMAAPPAWMEIRPAPPLLVATLLRLGAGETEALSLAQALQADLVLLDDLEARAEAERHALAVMGTLRVLELAAEHGLLDLPAVITQLETTSFHLPSRVVRDMLARDVARKAPPPPDGR